MLSVVAIGTIARLDVSAWHVPELQAKGVASRNNTPFA